jgi:hypothetical protein
MAEGVILRDSSNSGSEREATNRAMVCQFTHSYGWDTSAGIYLGRLVTLLVGSFADGASKERARSEQGASKERECGGFITLSSLEVQALNPKDSVVLRSPTMRMMLVPDDDIVWKKRQAAWLPAPPSLRHVRAITFG